MTTTNGHAAAPLGRTLGRLAEGFALAWRSHRAAQQRRKRVSDFAGDLMAMSDRTLADMGFAREDILRIADRAADSR